MASSSTCRTSRHRWLVTLAAVGACLALAGCGTSGTQGAGDAPSPSESTTSTAAEVPASSSAAESPTVAPPLDGNAATNPACMLMSIDQVGSVAGLPVVGVLGLVTDPERHSESCTWYLEPTYLQASLVVQYTLYAEPPTSVKAYYEQMIQEGYADLVPNLGDIGKISAKVGVVVDAIDRRAEIHVTLLVHTEATAEDQAAAIELTRLVMAGITQ